MRNGDIFEFLCDSKCVRKNDHISTNVSKSAKLRSLKFAEVYFRDIGPLALQHEDGVLRQSKARIGGRRRRSEFGTSL